MEATILILFGVLMGLLTCAILDVIADIGRAVWTHVYITRRWKRW